MSGLILPYFLESVFIKLTRLSKHRLVRPGIFFLCSWVEPLCLLGRQAPQTPKPPVLDSFVGAQLTISCSADNAFQTSPALLLGWARLCGLPWRSWESGGQGAGLWRGHAVWVTVQLAPPGERQPPARPAAG